MASLFMLFAMLSNL